jgi:chromosome segregation ATPase
MTQQFHLEDTIAHCAQLMREIGNARNQLQSNSEKLREMVQEHSILVTSQRNLVELEKQHRSLMRQNHSLQGASKEASTRVASLDAQLQSLRRQTEMTELYLNLLDREIEEALRKEEAEERERAMQVNNARKGVALSASKQGEGGDEAEAAEVYQPWSRDDEIAYLTLETSQRALLSDVERLTQRVEDQKSELRTMLDTIYEGEQAVAAKRNTCAELEEEAKLWRAELERALMS